MMRINALGWTRWKRRTAAGGAALALVGGLAAGQAGLAGASDNGNGIYHQHNLVSDLHGVARKFDANLVNPWGLAELPGSPLWVANNNSDTATVYSGDRQGAPLVPVPLVVTFPKFGPMKDQPSNPTGQVGAGIPGQFIVDGSPSLFIFSSESGHIFAWGKDSGTLAKTKATSATAVYKGLALASDKGQPRLYATNFHDGTIDVFDGMFQTVAPAKGAFVDNQIPSGFAPFGIQNINGLLYVTYALQKPGMHDDQSGPGNGFVDVYSPDGTLKQRLIQHGDPQKDSDLNSPWGLVKASPDFGRFSNDLLVGNFGDGKVHAFDLATGKFQGTLKNDDGEDIQIDGLWGLIFGQNGDRAAGTPNTLFFSAGIAEETHGLLGSITAGED
jgi:uncharacterized protein (TIGR03118 family)